MLFRGKEPVSKAVFNLINFIRQIHSALSGDRNIFKSINKRISCIKMRLKIRITDIFMIRILILVFLFQFLNNE